MQNCKLEAEKDKSTTENNLSSPADPGQHTCCILASLQFIQIFLGIGHKRKHYSTLVNACKW